MQTVVHHICELVAQLSTAELRGEEIHEGDSLVELGMDSLRMVDLTIELEDRLQVRDFPIQKWADAEAAREGAQYTVGSLARAFTAFMEPHGAR
jgi:acyl carrier protein